MMIVIALIGGLILGILFFGGLWLTVKRTLGSPYVALWLLGSSLIRTGIVLTGFYFMAQGSLLQLLVSVAGFIAGRLLILKLTRQIEQKQVIVTESSPL
ncbi:F1F0 ATPase subunit 2 [Mucilaginibacter sp. UYP25]|uniref:ATP synthase subunit I n=1 Tax=unclassified Mucilaginibacter TaxID=2617802 RepID=UPI003399D30E